MKIKIKIHKKRGLVVATLIIMSLSIEACNNADKVVMENTESAITEKVQINETDNETNLEKELAFDSSKTITENIEILNNILETKYGKSFLVSTREEYEEAGQSDWTLILAEDKVGIDTATWRYDYDSDSYEDNYMDALLTTFIFFYDEEMGSSLWSLTGDLIDDGADETVYGFTHDGGRVIYKNGDIATYEPSDNDNFYIWLTPNKF